MIIESAHVKNYRSILDENLVCDSLTALVGANGTGKSALVRAIDLFYNSSPRLDAEDFYNGETSIEIRVAITFKDLCQDAKNLFSIYLQGDKLTVERVFQWDGSKVAWKYHGATLQCPDFQPIRDGLEVKDRGKTAKTAYQSVRSNPQYSTLPAWTILQNVENDLKQWEAANPRSCVRQRDDGQFFGFKEVAQGYLGRFTRFLFIPAVRDASDDTCEGRGSVLTSLMDLVVRSVIASKQELLRLKEDTQKKYQEILDPSQLTELTTLQDQLTSTLKTFVPDARVQLNWLPLSDISIPPPQADVKLNEDGYSSAVSRTGHGLQRAFILTMLQHLVVAQGAALAAQQAPSQPASQTAAPPLPNLLLAIEEPELYQHPNRQRHLAKIFLQLASGKTPGVAEKTQIIYTTHSPLLVGLDRINQIRLLRKVPNGEGKPKITKVVSTTTDKVAEVLWHTDNKPELRYTGTSLLPRLQAIMTPWMSEGFFADVAVLVEGEDDRAAILGIAKALGYELEGNGFSIIPCGGKASIDRPYIIFHQLGIPVYIIWDGDYGKGETEGVCEKCGRHLDRKPDPKYNRRILRLLGCTETDWPECVKDKLACFKYDLETTLRNEIGDRLFEECLEACQADYCICKRKHAMKNPNVIMTIITKAKEQGHPSSTLENIVENILALKGVSNP